MDDEESARWGTPEAQTRHHDLSVLLLKNLFTFEYAALCDGPPSREIGVKWDDSNERTYFRIAGDRAADMQMLSVSNQPARLCRQIDITSDRSSIIAQPAD